MKLIGIILGLLSSLSVFCQENVQQRLERLLAKNHYREALKYADSLRNAGENIPDLLFYAGKASEGVMRYTDACRYFQEWLAQDTTNREARIALAKSYSLAGRMEESMKDFEKLASEDTLDLNINFQLARLYQQTGKSLKAIPVYTRLLNRDSTNIVLLKRLGDAYAETGLIRSAVKYYCDAFQLDPREGGIAVKAINLMLANKEQYGDFIDYATALVDTALVYSPESANLLQTRGVLEYVANRFVTSEKTFTDLINNGEKAKLNYKFQGLSRYQLDKFSEALQPLALADSLYQDKQGNRTDLEVAIKYGETLVRIGNPLKALEVFEEIEEQLQPDNRFLSQLAVMCGMACGFSPKNHSKAVDYYWKAYKLNPKNTQAISNFVNYKYSILLDETERAKASAKEISTALFAHILFLQKVRDSTPVKKDSMHAASREILQKELEQLFFKNETKLTVMDPDGKNYTYSVEDIRKLIRL